MKNLKFFKCKHCGNVVTKVIDKNIPIFCCGQQMDEIFANTEDASYEKHLPVVEVINDIAKIKVGSVPHPMEPEHYINLIVVETDANTTVVFLNPKTDPSVEIYVGKAKLIAVYEYCNLHGLWKKQL